MELHPTKQTHILSVLRIGGGYHWGVLPVPNSQVGTAAKSDPAAFIRETGGRGEKDPLESEKRIEKGLHSEEDVFNNSWWKLEEALTVGRFDIAADFRALDIGASPVSGRGPHSPK